jgi:hypothetical protein
LEGLTFFSKKELDFKDWLIVTQMKLKGLHLTVEGKELIKHICNRMNVNRLSTNLNSNNTLTVKEQELVNKKIKILQPTYGGLPILFRGCPAKLGHPMGLNF